MRRAGPFTPSSSGSRKSRSAGSRRRGGSGDSASGVWRQCRASGASCAWRSTCRQDMSCWRREERSLRAGSRRGHPKLTRILPRGRPGTRAAVRHRKRRPLSPPAPLLPEYLQPFGGSAAKALKYAVEPVAPYVRPPLDGPHRRTILSNSASTPAMAGSLGFPGAFSKPARIISRSSSVRGFEGVVGGP